MKTTLAFHGAAGTVTGSRHLVQAGSRAMLLDCGMFQGMKALRQRNWAAPAFDPAAVDAVVLSHAHIDHSGYLPVLLRRGFEGRIYCTAATAALLGLLLPDAAYLQEEEAARANRHGYAKHKPALPLYTVADANRVLERLAPRPYHDPFEPIDGVTASFGTAGHILGSATVALSIDGAPRPLRVAFSGDLGRWGRPILRDPEPIARADVLLSEATYGNREHGPDVDDELARVVNEAAHRGGALLIPAFAVGRTQELLWRLRQLEDRGAIPILPVYADSPMAINATQLYLEHTEEHDAEARAYLSESGGTLCTNQFATARTPAESKALNDLQGPVVIISASGMATGGRILHHLRLRLPDRRTTVLMSGFQAAGTRGRSLQDGVRTLRIHGREVEVRATIETLDGMSAHADCHELRRWFDGFTEPPKQTFLVHAEPDAASALRDTIRGELGWEAHAATDGQVVDLA